MITFAKIALYTREGDGSVKKLWEYYLKHNKKIMEVQGMLEQHLLKLPK